MTEQQVSKDEQIGFHKGALSTLSKEREEMKKILGIVEQLMQMHIKALKDMGVDLVAQAQQSSGTQGQPQSPQPGQPAQPLDQMVNRPQ